MKQKVSKIADLRKEYKKDNLQENQLNKSPFTQFNTWFEEARQSSILEVHAMTLASANKNGRPSARTVLLKGFSEDGFIFYTNYQSRKGQDLIQNPFASLLFYWDVLERQIRIEGTVVKVSAAISDAYFQKRPKGSRIGAIASPQSQVIASRNVLEQKVAELERTYATQESIPRPEHWGGFLLKPNNFEFWQGRPSRLHDRIQYILQEKEQWKIQRLAP